MTRLMKPPILAALLLFPAFAAEPVKVFILAGQSNMEGKVQRKLIDHQATVPETAKTYAHLRKGNDWIVRDDVFINFLGEHGGLTVGYGSRDRTGVELELGTVLGDHFKEPVLLIKTAWGGHSLVQKFRSPSAGLPPQEKLDEELEKACKKVEQNNEKNQRNQPLPTMADIKATYGTSYRSMLTEVNRVLTNKDSLFPALEGRDLELAGFVWFQGWNDQYNDAEQEYANNMTHFIHDVRKDLKAPKLPFVIGVMGQNGSKPAKGPMLVIQEAQLSMEDIEEFKGNVKAVRTDELVDKEAEALYPTWKEDIDRWEKTGSDHPYHYLGSGIWHLRMGHAFAEALLEME